MYRDKIVVVTGGANGIGAALAKGYLTQGATVVSLDIATGSLNGCDYRNLDLGDTAQISTAFADIREQYGTVHVLVNNGAITRFHKPVNELTPEDFTNVITVNLIGAFACASEFIKANAGQSYGRIVNIASTRWHQNESGWDAYGASKGGLVSLTNSLTVSLSETPITVNAISPGWIETGDYDALSTEDHSQHPSGRVGKPQDIVNACLFFTHPDNDFANGSNLIIDGGMTKKMIYVE